MFDKIKNTILLIFMTIALLVGLLSIYRGTLKTKDLTIIIGKVLDKKILYSTSAKSGRHYSLTFSLDNRQEKIAINLGTKSQSDKDSAFYLIDIGKSYQFYLDPTIPTQNGVNCGISKIDYNGIEVYKTSNKLNLYGGIFISILSLAAIIAVIKFNTKGNVS